jgi:plastocyanin
MHAHRTTSRLAAIGFALSLVLVVAGCGSSSGSSSKTTTTTATASDAGGGSGGGGNAITIKGFKYMPLDLKAKVGDKITVTNNDAPATHTFTSTDGPQKFDSGNIKPGKSYTVTLTKKGTIKYQCDIHNYMKGTITVS